MMKYRVRNRLHEVLGEFSRSEILRSISTGKFLGEEEISIPPHETWQKLASHPDFFDAFLKKLTSGQYKGLASEDSAEEEGKKDSGSVGGATRQVSEAEQVPDPAELKEASEEKFGLTIHQSAIKELFKESDVGEFNRGTSKDPAENPLERDLKEFDPEVKGPTPELATPLNEARKKSLREKLSTGRFRLWLATAGGLVLLYYFGSNDTELPLETSRRVEPTSKESLRQIFAKSEKESQLKALILEGDGLVSLDLRSAYRAAVEAYREALALEETNSAILGKLAEVKARLLMAGQGSDQERQEIRKLIERGRNEDPQGSVFYRIESLLAFQKKNFAEASAHAAAALKSDPLNAESYLLMGEIALAQNEAKTAFTFFQDAQKLGFAGARGHYLRGQAALILKEYPAANAASLDSLKQNTFHAATYHLLGDIASAEGRLKDAKGLYETAGRLAKLSDGKVSARAYFRLGVLNEISGNAQMAKENFRLAYHYDPSMEGLKDKLSGLNLDAKELKAMAEQVEYAPEYFLHQGKGFLLKNKPKEMTKFALAAYLCDPQDVSLIMELGKSIERVGSSQEDFQRVVILYQRAIELNPSSAGAYLQLGLLESEQFNFERGYKLLKQAEALDPENPDVFVALLKHFYKRQDFSEAVRYLQKARQLAPTNSEISYYAGLLRLLIKKDAIKDAMPFFHQAYMQDPQNYDAMVEWLKLKVASFERTFALKFVRSLLDGDPSNPKLHWALGEVYAAGKEFRRAIPYYYKSLDLDNRSSRVRMSLAQALESVGDTERAVEEYRMASLLDKRNTEGLFRAAELLFTQAKYRESEETLKYLTNIVPNYPGAHRTLSRIYRLTRQKDLAVKMMRREVEASPQNAKFRLELAELLMEYEQIAEAIVELVVITNLPSITKAPEYVYDKVRGFLLLSRCYRLQGKLESAEGAVRLALDIDANDPELHKELGYVYYGMQRDKEGVKEFELYLARNPAASDAETIRNLIRQMQIEE